MRLIIAAFALLIAGNAFAQDSNKPNDPDAIKTATAAEVKAKADQGAAAIHELPYVKEEVERERVATEKAAAASKKAVQQVNQSSETKPSPAVKTEQTKETAKKNIDPKK